MLDLGLKPLGKITLIISTRDYYITYSFIYANCADKLLEMT